jgi:hypothetical protein
MDMLPPYLPPRDKSAIGWLRLCVLLATLSGVLSSIPLWLASREYPLLPVASWWPVLRSPWDAVLLAILLGSLLLAGWFFRPAVIVFLILSLFLVLSDQNREQPWFYMYALLLLALMFRSPISLTLCRLIISAVYIWGGVQKINPVFFKVVPVWFVSPATKWLSPELVSLFQWTVAAAPAIEIFIGFALWWQPVRKLAIGAVCAVHVLALIFLGPWGHGYNLVVWPWNLAMIAIVILLFPRGRLERPISTLNRCWPAWALAVLVCVLPTLSYTGKWDSYLSFSLYSGSLATADIYVTESFRERLPEKLKRFTHALQTYNEEVQGPYVFDHQSWAMAELGVPPLPEPRAYRNTWTYLSRKYAANPQEIRMVLAPRTGPILLYQGESASILNLTR